MLLNNQWITEEIKQEISEFPGRPVVRTLRFHCQGPRFNPWIMELRSHKLCGAAKKKKKKRKSKKYLETRENKTR